MTRILYLCEYPTVNGGERSLLATFTALRQTGYSISVAGPASGQLRQAMDAAKVTFHPLELHDQKKVKLPADELIRRISTVIENAKPDLVHANSLSMSRLLGQSASDLPRVGHLRDIMKLSRSTIRDLNALDQIVAVSNATADFHIEQGLAEDRVTVIHNGIDCPPLEELGSQESARRILDLDNETLLFTTIGQIGMRKGLDVVLDAIVLFATESDLKRPLEWWVVGERFSNKAEAIEYASVVEACAAKVACENLRIRWLGWRDDVLDILLAADVYLHGARQEPLGRVLLEAGRCATPVIATDVGGTREIFPSEDAGGVIVPPDDVASFARAIDRLASHDNERKEQGLAAYRRISEHFTVQATSADLHRVYSNNLQIGS